jgi:hypothetical protein
MLVSIVPSDLLEPLDASIEQTRKYNNNIEEHYIDYTNRSIGNDFKGITSLAGLRRHYR